MNLKTYILALLAAAALSGCSILESVDLGPRHEAHALPYHENSLSSLELGRHYQAAGRYELARETFLQGLATARHDDMKMRLASELEATDRLVLSSR